MYEIAEVNANDVPIIESVRRDNAKDFLRELDEDHDSWGEGHWIFRGQNDASLLLHPSAMRDSFLKDYVCRITGESFDALKDRWLSADATEQEREDMLFRLMQHILIENRVVSAFALLADQSGLSVPYERVERIEVLEHLINQINWHETIKVDPGKIALQINPDSIYFALAQHHQIPTRLLDFTYRPFVAAFFAAYSETEYHNPPDDLVVWAVNLRTLYRTSLRPIKHWRSRIGFLQAQDGIFIYDSKANEKYLLTGTWQPLEGQLLLLATSGVVKLTMPYGERNDLLQRLRQKRITRSYLMPTFDNVREEIKDDPKHWTDYVLWDAKM